MLQKKWNKAKRDSQAWLLSRQLCSSDKTLSHRCFKFSCAKTAVVIALNSKSIERNVRIYMRKSGKCAPLTLFILTRTIKQYSILNNKIKANH